MKNELVIDSLNYGILYDINISFNVGTINALVGNSASGKTTLLKCISCIPRNFSDITLNGDVIAKSKTDVGLFLGTVNLSRKPVLENIMEPLLNIKIPYLKAKNKVYKITKMLGINDLVYKNIDELSYSQKKMVAFCKTIITSPKVILLDNIFDSLDEKYKNIILEYFKELKENNNSIVIYTSNSSEDLMISDNIIVLKKGEIIANDSKENILLNEDLLTKIGLKSPFIIDLSHKLKAYELIDDIFYDSKKLVGELWK